MEHSEVNVEKLIHEVKKRPAIWDTVSSDYNNRELRWKSWEELVEAFIEKEDPTITEKKELGQRLARRWKSLRDCYCRELQRQKCFKSGSMDSRRPVYVYFKQLSFLKNIVKVKDTTNSGAENDIQPTSEVTSMRARETVLPSVSSESKRRKPIHSVEEEVINTLHRAVDIMEGRNREQSIEDDCDKMFLMSLLTPLKQIPEYARFGVKRKLMEVLEVELNKYVTVPNK
ncbi:uncharacterized protein [Anabrus simplex]|uniref:uncharacterized protein n=1 Tax=Anabrus simplex TaxID=316456 RepID=UPI0035A274E8